MFSGWVTLIYDVWVFTQLVPETSSIPLRAFRQLGSTVFDFALLL